MVAPRQRHVSFDGRLPLLEEIQGVLRADELPGEPESAQYTLTFHLGKCLCPIFNALEELFQADDLRPCLNDLLKLVVAIFDGLRFAATVFLVP